MHPQQITIQSLTATIFGKQHTRTDALIVTYCITEICDNVTTNGRVEITHITDASGTPFKLCFQWLDAICQHIIGLHPDQLVYWSLFSI